MSVRSRLRRRAAHLVLLQQSRRHATASPASTSAAGPMALASAWMSLKRRRFVCGTRVEELEGVDLVLVARRGTLERLHQRLGLLLAPRRLEPVCRSSVVLADLVDDLLELLPEVEEELSQRRVVARAAGWPPSSAAAAAFSICASVGCLVGGQVEHAARAALVLLVGVEGVDERARRCSPATAPPDAVVDALLAPRDRTACRGAPGGWRATTGRRRSLPPSATWSSSALSDTLGFLAPAAWCRRASSRSRRRSPR